MIIKIISLFIEVLKKKTLITLLLAVFLLFSSLTFIIKIIFLQMFFDSINDLINTGDVSKGLIILFAAIFFLNLAEIFFNTYTPYVVTKFQLNISKLLTRKLSTICSKIELIKFEDNEYLNFINKALNGVGTIQQMIFIVMEILFFYIPFIFFLYSYYYNLSSMLSFFVVIAFMPALINQIIRVKVYKKLEDVSGQLRRECEYYRDCIISKEYFKETRLTGAYELFNNYYKSAIRRLADSRIKFEINGFVILYVMKIVTIIAYTCAIIIIVLNYIKGYISIGSVSAMYLTIDKLFRIAEDMVYKEFGGLSENFGASIYYLKFVEQPLNDCQEIEVYFNDKIDLKEVSFNYPSNDKEVLRNINITIRKGEHIAIVGENGSGKSTLSKILIGLYNPTVGTVKYDGKNIKTSNNRFVLNKSSAVFQKFCKYSFSIEDNVKISQTYKIDDTNDEDNIKRALINSGFTYESKYYKEKLKTILGRDFGGIDLSGGQWQRLAIARGIYREHEIIVLDEPTAAIDPIEERNLYNQFMKISKNKTAIIITHRMGSIKSADKIVVLKNHGIVEFGGFDELITKKGEFYSMYKLQADLYK